MEQKIKKGLLVLILAVLLLPYIQHRWPLYTPKVLQGYFSNAPDVKISLKGWMDGSFQEGEQKHYNDHVGFREELVRLNGQIDYSLFQKLDYGGTTLGTDNYLYYNNYLDAYYGRDFVGRRVLRERMLKLKALQDTMAREGKTLLLVFNACKAWYSAEHIPPAMREPHGVGNNYTISAQLADSLGVKHINFNAWFLKLKPSSKELLFSSQGIHWTTYGSLLAGDSLIRFLEQERNIQMVHPRWTSAVRTNKPRFPDADLADILNLMFPPQQDTFTYPDVNYPEQSGVTRPECLFIGDSYTTNMLHTGLIQHMSSSWQLWFYNKSIFNKDNWDKGGGYPQVEKENWQATMKKADCIILMYTAMNGGNIGSGFIEAAYAYYFGSKPMQ